MDKVTVISLCIMTMFSSSHQQFNYNTNNQQNQFNNQYKDEANLIGNLGAPVYKSSTPPSLSKLFKPRPAALKDYFNDEKSPHPNLSQTVESDNSIGKTGYVSQGKNPQSYPVHISDSSYSNNQNILPKFPAIIPVVEHSQNYIQQDKRYETHNDLYQDEPPNYEFTYEIVEPQYYLEFGHRESRQGEVARGAYHVLLPDGRIQLVEYLADENGFKPTVTYQQKVQPSYGSRY